MSRSKRTANPASTSTSSEPDLAPKPAPQLTQKQKAAGIALAGGSIATPLLLALLDKALSLEEIQAICHRAREIAGHFDDLPEGKFALACIDDFLLPRNPNRSGHDTDSVSPAIVPSDAPDGSQRSGNEDSSETQAPSSRGSIDL